MLNPCPKHKAIRLKGKKLIALYEAVYERDGGICQKCKKNWIEPGTIPHHKILKSQGGEDTKENLEMRCLECHDVEHN